MGLFEYHLLRNVQEDLVLHVDDDAGEIIALRERKADCHRQYWDIQPCAIGHYARIRHLKTGLYLELRFKDGRLALADDEPRSSEQYWQFEPVVPSGAVDFYHMRNQRNGLTLGESLVTQLPERARRGQMWERLDVAGYETLPDCSWNMNYRDAWWADYKAGLSYDYKKISRLGILLGVLRPSGDQKSQVVGSLVNERQCEVLADGCYIFAYKYSESRYHSEFYPESAERGSIFYKRIGADNCDAADRIRHSQLAAFGYRFSQRVFSAGEFFVEAGKIVKVNNNSGHFRPWTSSLDYVFNKLASLGFDTEGIERNPVDAAAVENYLMRIFGGGIIGLWG